MLQKSIRYEFDNDQSMTVTQDNDGYVMVGFGDPEEGILFGEEQFSELLKILKSARKLSKQEFQVP